MKDYIILHGQFKDFVNYNALIGAQVNTVSYFVNPCHKIISSKKKYGKKSVKKRERKNNS